MIWKTPDAAPMHKDLLGWRKDCGVMLVRLTSLDAFLSEQEIESGEYDEDTLTREDWFYADFGGGGRLEGDMIPTLWTHLPEEPSV